MTIFYVDGEKICNLNQKRVQQMAHDLRTLRVCEPVIH
jgi:hypothetical protein